MRASFILMSLVLIALAPSLPAATHDVGPGQPLASIGDVPWATLMPGDVVRIHWRSTPYREKWVIGRSGTATAPIVVRGVPGPLGERPIIDGADAITAPGLNFWSETRGIIKIGGSNTPSSTVVTDIVVEGLEIRGARDSNTFTDDGGNIVAYGANASSFYVELGERIVVRDCELHDCGNGFFVASSSAAASRDILVERCSIHDNGNVGSIYEHGNYTVAIGIVFQFNHFGPMLPGAGGNNLKDRSAGLVIRWNWIEGGNRQLDLVDAEDSTLIRDDPSYRDTWVYGNVLIERDADGNRQVLHYGGDSGTLSDYRKGTLHFYNNSVVSYRTDRTTLMRLSTNEERCDARNNIVWCASAPGTTLALLDQSGILDWSHDAVAPGWVATFGTLSGVINDDGTQVNLTTPGFVDESGQDFHLRIDSACVDSGAALEAAALQDHALTNSYFKHQGSERRDMDGALDIGAYETLCVLPSPGFVEALRVTRAGLTWDPAQGPVDSHDVVMGSLAEWRSAGAPGASVQCLERAGTDRIAVDPSPTLAGGTWYLVRGRGCGNGTWNSSDPMQVGSRDSALVPACE